MRKILLGIGLLGGMSAAIMAFLRQPGRLDAARKAGREAAAAHKRQLQDDFAGRKARR